MAPRLLGFKICEARGGDSTQRNNEVALEEFEIEQKVETISNISLR